MIIQVDPPTSKYFFIIFYIYKAANPGMHYVIVVQMVNRRAVFLCNLKPAKMRGILSEGMIMCASTPDKVEIITPPEGSAIGDRIIVDGYAGKQNI